MAGMTIAETLLPEFDRETGVTRRLLERVPEGQFDWQPHAKSMTLGRLAEHVAELSDWVGVAVTRDGFDMETPRPPDYQPARTRNALLALFDAKSAAARATLAGRTDGELLAPWSLRRDGKTLFTMPKNAVLRFFVLNHMVHHRGQLSVYLRMHDVPLPSIYGPSADESM
jgi:uncharacterized damage-inducible protein DinB